jgi:hypothetical protein
VTNNYALISAVIPTLRRPELVTRAVQSVMAQTHPHMEILVIVDGPDLLTVEKLTSLDCAWLRIISLPESVGGSEARNIGVREASGEWIAFLDDDDIWLPQKAERQLAAAQSFQGTDVVISSRFIARSDEQDQICPARVPALNQRIDEYICCPEGWGIGEGFLQTSTFFVRKDLMLRIPFVYGLKRGQDFAWMIQVCNKGNAVVHVVPEVLSIFTAQTQAEVQRISRHPQWRSLHDWIRSNRIYFTPKTYSFCLTQILLPDVLQCKESLSVRVSLLKECIIDGKPTLKCLIIFILKAFFPLKIVRWIRSVAFAH